MFKPEGEQSCDQSSGVREFIYQLSDMRRSASVSPTRDILPRRDVTLFFACLLLLGAAARKRGCSYIHHLHWLAHNIGQNLPRDRIITPYIAPHHVEAAVERAGLNPLTGDISVATTPLRAVKENIVLIDDDVPGHIQQHIIRLAQAHNGTGVVVKGFSKAQLGDLYLKAKLVFDYCMRGAERMPLEASLFGAILTTNNPELDLRAALFDRRADPARAHRVAMWAVLDAAAAAAARGGAAADAAGAAGTAALSSSASESESSPPHAGAGDGASVAASSSSSPSSSAA